MSKVVQLENFLTVWISKTFFSIVLHVLGFCLRLFVVVVGRFWLHSLFQVVSGGEHHSAAEGADVRLGRFWLLYLVLANFRMFRLLFGFD